MALLVVVAIFNGPAQAADTTPVPFTEAKFTEVVNDVTIVNPTDLAHPETAKADMMFEAPDLLRTGRRSRAQLTAKDGTIARVGSNTVFSFEPNSRTIHLQQGSVLFNSPKGLGGGTIVTNSATATVLGTTIIVAATNNGGFKVLVLEGHAQIDFSNGQRLTLGPGQMTFVLPGPKTTGTGGTGGNNNNSGGGTASGGGSGGNNNSAPGPILNFDLARLTQGSDLVTGFTISLPSINLVIAATNLQQTQISTGTLNQTNQAVVGVVSQTQVVTVNSNAVEAAINAIQTQNNAASTIANLTASTPTSLQVAESTDVTLGPGLTLPTANLFTTPTLYTSANLGLPTGTLPRDQVYLSGLFAGNISASGNVDLSALAPLAEIDLYANGNFAFTGNTTFNTPSSTSQLLMIGNGAVSVPAGITITANITNPTNSHFNLGSVNSLSLGQSTISNPTGEMDFFSLLGSISLNGTVVKAGSLDTNDYSDTGISLTAFNGNVSITGNSSLSSAYESDVDVIAAGDVLVQNSTLATGNVSNYYSGNVDLEAGGNLTVQSTHLRAYDTTLLSEDLLTLNGGSLNHGGVSSVYYMVAGAPTVSFGNLGFTIGGEEQPQLYIFSQNGLLAPGANTGSTTVAGDVNFLDGVTYDGLPAQEYVSVAEGGTGQESQEIVLGYTEQNSAVQQALATNVTLGPSSPPPANDVFGVTNGPVLFTPLEIYGNVTNANNTNNNSNPEIVYGLIANTLTLNGAVDLSSLNSSYEESDLFAKQIVVASGNTSINYSSSTYNGNLDAQSFTFAPGAALSFLSNDSNNIFFNSVNDFNLTNATITDQQGYLSITSGLGNISLTSANVSSEYGLQFNENNLALTNSTLMAEYGSIETYSEGGISLQSSNIVISDNDEIGLQDNSNLSIVNSTLSTEGDIELTSQGGDSSDNGYSPGNITVQSSNLTGSQVSLAAGPINGVITVQGSTIGADGSNVTMTSGADTIIAGSFLYGSAINPGDGSDTSPPAVSIVSTGGNVVVVQSTLTAIGDNDDAYFFGNLVLAGSAGISVANSSLNGDNIDALTKGSLSIAGGNMNLSGGGGNTGFITLLAGATLSINNVVLGNTSNLILAGSTVNLSTLDLPANSTLFVFVPNGTLAPNPNTGNAAVSGDLNFISNVTYNGSAAQNTLDVAQGGTANSTLNEQIYVGYIDSGAVPQAALKTAVTLGGNTTPPSGVLFPNGVYFPVSDLEAAGIPADVFQDTTQPPVIDYGILGGNITMGGNIALDSLTSVIGGEFDISAGGTLTTTGNTILIAPSTVDTIDIYALGNVTIAPGSILKANFTGNFDFTTFDVSVLPSLTFNGGKVLNPTGELDIESWAGNLGFNGTKVFAGADVELMADNGNFTFGNGTITSGNVGDGENDVNLFINGTVSVQSSNLTATGNLNVTAGSDIAFTNSTLLGSEGINLNATTGNLVIQSSNLTSSNDEVSLNAGAGVTLTNSTLTTDNEDEISVNAGTDITSTNTTFNAEQIYLQSGTGNIAVASSNLTAEYYADLEAGLDVTVTNSILSGYYEVYLDSYNGNIAVLSSNFTAQGSDISLYAEDNITVTNSSLNASDIYLQADSGSLAVQSSNLTSTDGDIQFSSYSNLSVTNSSVESEYEISLASSAGGIAVTTGNLEADYGEVSLNAVSDITVANSTLFAGYQDEGDGYELSLQSNTGNVVIQSSNLTASDGIAIQAGNISGSVSVLSSNITGYGYDDDGVSLAAGNQSGTLLVQSGNIMADYGNLSLSAGGNITVTNSTLYGYVYEYSYSPSNATTLGITSVNGAIAISNSNLTAAPGGEEYYNPSTLAINAPGAISLANTTASADAIEVEAGGALSITGGNLAPSSSEDSNPVPVTLLAGTSVGTTLTINGTIFDGTGNLILAGNTVNLSTLDLPANSTVFVYVPNGTLAPNPNTGNAAVAGDLNFLANVTYNGSAAQNSLDVAYGGTATNSSLETIYVGYIDSGAVPQAALKTAVTLGGNATPPAGVLFPTGVYFPVVDLEADGIPADAIQDPTAPAIIFGVLGGNITMGGNVDLGSLTSVVSNKFGIFAGGTLTVTGNTTFTAPTSISHFTLISLGNFSAASGSVLTANFTGGSSSNTTEFDFTTLPSLTLNGGAVINPTGELDLASWTGGLALNGTNVTAGTDVVLDAYNGNIALANSTVSSSNFGWTDSDVDLSANGTLSALSSNLAATGNLNVTAGSDITLTNSTLLGPESISLNSTAGNLTVQSASNLTSAYNDIYVNANSSITVSNSTLWSEYETELQAANGSVSLLSSNLSAEYSELHISSGANLTITNSTLYAGDEEELYGNANSTITVTNSTLTTGGELQFDSNNGPLTVLSSNLTGCSDVYLDSSTDLTVSGNSNIYAGDEINLDSSNGNTLVQSSDLDGGDYLYVTADKALTVANSTLSGYYQLELESNDGDTVVQSSSVTSSEGGVSIYGDLSLAVTNSTLTSGDELYLQSNNGPVSIQSSNLTATDYEDIYASNDLAISGNTDIYGGYQDYIQSYNGNVSVQSSTISAGQYLYLYSEGDLNVSGNSALSSYYNMNLQSYGGNVSVLSSNLTSSESDIQATANLNLTVANSNLTSEDELDLETDNGLISVQSSNLTSEDDEVYLDANTSVTVTNSTLVANDDDELQINAGGDLTVTNSTLNGTYQDYLQSYNGNVSLLSATLPITDYIEVYAGSDITIANSSLSSYDEIYLSATNGSISVTSSNLSSQYDDISAYANTSLTVTNSTLYGEDITLQSYNGSVMVTSSNLTGTDGDVDVQAYNGSVTIADSNITDENDDPEITANLDLSITNSTLYSEGESSLISESGNVTVANSNLTADEGDLEIYGNLSVSATNSTLYSEYEMDVESYNGSVTVANSNLTSQYDEMDITSNLGLSVTNSTLIGGEGIYLQSYNGSVTVANSSLISYNDDPDISAYLGLNVTNSTIYSQDDSLSMESATAGIAVSSGNIETGYGDIDLYANTGITVTNSTLYAGAYEDGSYELGLQSNTGNITVQSSNLTATDGVSLEAGNVSGSVSVLSSNIIGYGDDGDGITLSAGNQSSTILVQSSNLTAEAGNIALSAGSNITVTNSTFFAYANDTSDSENGNVTTLAIQSFNGAIVLSNSSLTANTGMCDLLSSLTINTLGAITLTNTTVVADNITAIGDAAVTITGGNLSRSAGDGNPEPITLEAGTTLAINGTILGGTSSLVLASNTVSLNSLSIPANSTVYVYVGNGNLAANPNTGATLVAGSLNFIGNVSYNGTGAQGYVLSTQGGTGNTATQEFFISYTAEGATALTAFSTAVTLNGTNTPPAATIFPFGMYFSVTDLENLGVPGNVIQYQPQIFYGVIGGAISLSGNIQLSSLASVLGNEFDIVAGQSLTITGNTNLAASGSITKINLVSSGPLTVAPGSVITGNFSEEDPKLEIDAPSITLTGGEVTNPDNGEVDLGSFNGSLTLNGTSVVAGSNVELDSNNGDTLLTGNASIVGEYGINLKSSGNITVSSSNIDVDYGNISLGANGSVSLVNSSLTLYYSDDNTTSANISANGSISLTNSTIAAGMCDTDLSINLNSSNGTITLASSNLTALDDQLNVNAGSDITVTNSTLDGQEDLNLISNNGNVTVQSSNLTSDYSDLSIYSNLSLMVTNATLDSESETYLQSYNGTVSVQSSNLTSWDDAIDAYANLSLAVANSTLSSDDEIYLQSYNGTVSVESSNLWAGDYFYAYGNADVSVANSTVGSYYDQNLQSYNGNVSLLSSNLTAQYGSQYIYSNLSLTVTNSTVAGLGYQVELQSNNGPVSVQSSNLTAQYYLYLTANNDLTVGGNSTLSAYYDVDLDSENGNTTVQSSNLTSQDSTVSVDADLGITVQSSNLTSEDSNVNVESGTDLTITNSTLYAGDQIYLQSDDTNTTVQSSNLTAGSYLYDYASNNITVANSMLCGAYQVYLYSYDGNTTVLSSNLGSYYGEVYVYGDVSATIANSTLTSGSENNVDVYSYGNISVTNSTLSASYQDYVQSYSSNVTVQSSNLTSDDSVYIYANRDMSISANSTLSAPYEIYLDAQNGNLSVQSSNLTSFYEDVSLYADLGLNVTYATLSASDSDIDLNAQYGNFTLQSSNLSSDTLELTSYVGNIDIGGSNLTSNGYFEVFTNENVTIDNSTLNINSDETASVIGSDGNTTITATNITDTDVYGSLAINATYNLTIGNGSNITTENGNLTASNGNLVVTGNSTFTSNSTSNPGSLAANNGNLTVSANSTVNLNAGGSLTAGQALTVDNSTVSNTSVASINNILYMNAQVVTVTNSTIVATSAININAATSGSAAGNGNMTIANSTLNAPTVNLNALNTLTVNAVNLNNAVAISMGARTINLSNINFPSGSSVNLSSQNGVLAPNPNTSQLPAVGDVNFITHVNYGGSPAQNFVPTSVGGSGASNAPIQIHSL